MINVRNIKRKYAFKHILFRKPFSYLTTLSCFHNNNSISPRKLFFSNRFSIIDTCRFSVKSIFKDFLSSLASVLVLITDKQYIHSRYTSGYLNIKFTLTQIVEGGSGISHNNKLSGTMPTIL